MSKIPDALMLELSNVITSVRPIYRGKLMGSTKMAKDAAEQFYKQLADKFMRAKLTPEQFVDAIESNAEAQQHFIWIMEKMN